MSDIRLGRGGKVGSVNPEQIKGGLKKEQIKDKNLQSVFDSVDVNKDGVIDNGEMDNFKRNIQDAAGNETLSSREAKKYLSQNNIKDIDNKDLLKFIDILTQASENIESSTVTENNGQKLIQIKYKDGSTETINPDKTSEVTSQSEIGEEITGYYDKNKKLTRKKTTNSEGTTTVSNYDENGGLTQTVETRKGGNPITTIQYQDGKPQTKTLKDGTTVESYTYNEQGEPVLNKKVENQGIPAKEKVTEYIYNEDGTLTANITENDRTTVQTIKDDKVQQETITQNGKTTQRTYTESGFTEVTDDGTITTTNFNNDGKKLYQIKTVDGLTYFVEYDGNGNTKGVVVQNGEIPAAIAKKFGCSVQDLINTNPDSARGKASNKYFSVGADIVIPGEMNADKFAELNAGRQTKAQAIAGYTRMMEAREAQKRSEDEELAARKGHERTFTEQKWNTFEECAKAYYEREGVNNPTKRQIQLRIDELKELNPNLKDGEIKGKKLTATFSPEVDAQIGKTQQAREAARIQQKQKAEAAAGKNMAQVMYSAMDDHWGGVSEKDFQAKLQNVNANNVVGLLKQYNEISPDETLIEAIMDETSNKMTTRKATIDKIINSLIKRAESANVSDERQKQAIEACKKELDSYWSLGIGYCQTSKLDGLVNNLIGTIDAAEALTHEEKSQMNDTGINETLGLMSTQVSENTSALNAQLAEDGWCADLYEGLKWCVGSNNLDENVKADLNKYKGYINQLQQAEKNRGEAGFKTKFKEIFGVDYDPKLMKGYNRLQSNFAMAQGLTMQKDGFKAEFGSCMNGQENYAAMRNKYGSYLTQIAQSEGQNINANNAVDTAIATQLKKQGIDINKATDAQKQQALKTVITNTYNAIDSELNKYTHGRSLTNMEKQLKNAGSAVFGNKNDIAFRVNDYISSQQQGGAAVNMAVKAVGAIAIGIATGGTGLAALVTVSVATATLSTTVDLTDRVSSDVGLKEGEITNILKNATIDGASVFVGGQVGKFAAMFKSANSFVQAGGRLAMMAAGDAATGAAAEYMQTGTITLEGVAFQAVFSAAGNLVSLKQLGKADVPGTKPTQTPAPDPAPAPKPTPNPVSEPTPAPKPTPTPESAQVSTTKTPAENIETEQVQSQSTKVKPEPGKLPDNATFATGIMSNTNAAEQALKSADLTNPDVIKNYTDMLVAEFPAIKNYPKKGQFITKLQTLMNHPDYEKLSDLNKTMAKLSILKGGNIINPDDLYSKYKIPVQTKRRIEDIEYVLQGENLNAAAALYHKGDIDVFNILNDVTKKLDKTAISQVKDVVQTASAQGHMIIQQSHIVNPNKIPEMQVIKDGSTFNVKVIDLTDDKVLANLEQYGFDAGTTLEDLRLTVHMNDDFNKAPRQTIGRMMNTRGELNLSASMTDGTNHLYGDMQFGIVLDYDQGSVSYASNYAAGTGFGKGRKSFSSVKLGKSESLENGLFIRERFIENMKSNGVEVSVEDYTALTTMFKDKKMTSYNFNKMFPDGKITVNGKVFTTEDVQNALSQSSSDLLTMRAQINGKNFKKGFNEVNIYNPEIKAIYVRDNGTSSIDQILSADLLKYAQDKKIPIVFQRSSFAE